MNLNITIIDTFHILGKIQYSRKKVSKKGLTLDAVLCMGGSAFRRKVLPEYCEQSSVWVGFLFIRIVLPEHIEFASEGFKVFNEN